VNAAVARPSHLLITAVGTPRRCTDDEWSAALEAALMVARRHDLEHGTPPAYVRGCVCKECRGHQQLRLGRSR
jgi:hypothetical protein